MIGLYMARPNGCRHETVPAEAETLPREGPSALVVGPDNMSLKFCQR